MKKLVVAALAVLFVVPLYASQEYLTLDDLEWALKPIRERVFALGDAVADVQAMVDELHREQPSLVSLNCEEFPNGVQDAHDAGATRVWLARELSDGTPTSPAVCNDLIITKDNFLVTTPGGGPNTIPNITIAGAHNVSISEVRTNNIEVLNSTGVNIHSASGDRLRIVNSQVRLAEHHCCGETTHIIGSSVTVTVGSSMYGDIWVRRSELDLSDGGAIRGRLYLETGSTLNLDRQYGLGAHDLICDPQTSRVYDPHNFVTNITYQPPQTSTETCLITQPNIYP